MPPGCSRLPGDWEEAEPSRCGRCGRWTAAGARFCAGHEPFCAKHSVHYVDVCSGCEAEDLEAFYAAEESYGAAPVNGVRDD